MRALQFSATQCLAPLSPSWCPKCVHPRSLFLKSTLSDFLNVARLKAFVVAEKANLIEAGIVTIRGEQLEMCSEFLELGLSGKQLAAKNGVYKLTVLNKITSWTLQPSHLVSAGFFGKSDPYFEISKSREDGSWVPVYRSPSHSLVTKTLASRPTSLDPSTSRTRSTPLGRWRRESACNPSATVAIPSPYAIPLKLWQALSRMQIINVRFMFH